MAFPRTLAVLALSCVIAGCSGGRREQSDYAYIPYPCDAELYHQKANDLRIYQVMVEAFIDGDAKADYGMAYGPSKHRGDLQGIINSLDYIQSLGLNAVWLTPIFESVSDGQDQWADRLDGTGYFASNYFRVDPNFGTSEQLRELVDKAHARGMYVFLDGVFGHFKYNAEDYPSPSGLTLSTDGEAQGATGRQAIYPDDLAFFKEVATYWIKEYKIDGWRLDQAYQVPVGAWGEIRKAVEDASKSVTYVNAQGQAVHPLGYMFGEIWNDARYIAKHGYGTAAQPGLCSNFDFPLRYSLVQTLAVEESGVGQKPATNINAGYMTRLAYPAGATPNAFVTNHDVVRFGDLLQRGGIAQPDDDEYWARHKVLFSLLANHSGPITLYYGDEIGDELKGFSTERKPCSGDGAGGKWCDDNVARTPGKIEGLASVLGEAPFVANQAQAELRDYVSALMALRANHPALRAGKRTPVPLAEELASTVLVEHKQHADETVVLVANVDSRATTLALSASQLGSAGALIDLQTGQRYPLVDGGYRLPVGPLSASFLKVEEPVAAGPQLK